MSFEDWIFSRYPADNSINGQWQLPHILTLIATIVIIVAIALIFGKKSEKARRIVIWVLVGMILFLEIARRVINLIKNPNPSFDHLMYLLLPRPLCAISCWTLIVATISNKKFLYNVGTFIALISAIIFFAYPEAGFNNKYILFEASYSIVSHMLLLITSISLMTLKIADFRFRTMWKELLYFAGILVYVAVLILTGIEGDPMYFMPTSSIVRVIPMPYAVFLVVYILFMIVYISSFYFINDRRAVKEYFNSRRKAKVIK